MRKIMTASVLLLAVLAGPGLAGNSSVYTTYDLKSCRVTVKGNAEEEASDTWACNGYKGKPEYEIGYAEGDLRGLMTIGRDPANSCSASMTFPGFNSAGNTVEWRLKDGKPIAAIVRWTVSYDPEDAEKHHTWLVVSKLEKGTSCHMAYVQGGLPKANEKARAVADAMAPGFSCKTGVLKTYALPGTNPNETPSGPACPKR